MRFDGTRVVITGGSSGIGLATARAFLAEGATVSIAGRDAGKLADAARTLNSPRLTTHKADVTDESQVRRLFATIGEVDVLVNNAGSNIKER